MEANKENYMLSRLHRIIKTRIPVPKDPLPPVPKHLTIDYIKTQEELRKRKPLGTLNAQAGPSRIPEKLDTRYVTVRGRDHHDWPLNIIRKELEVITISDDEEDRKPFMSLPDQHKKADVLMPFSPLEPDRIKNIKRSLKRPSSKELQGEKRIRFEDKPRSRNSLFNIKDRVRSPDRVTRQYVWCMERDYTARLFDYLTTTERRPDAEPHLSSTTRACLVNWLMKINGPDGDPAIIQTACWYLDSLLSKEKDCSSQQVHIDKLQLIGCACFWIAQKLHQAALPSLRLVRYSNYAFTTASLLAAEVAVLKKLNFPSKPIVPHDYIGYLAWLCDPELSGEIEVAASFLCLCSVLVHRATCREFPSVLAAASVKNALLLMQRKELYARLTASRLYQAAIAKTKSFTWTCCIQRQAVRTVSCSKYDYKTPLEHYGVPPLFIAQKISRAVFRLQERGL